MVSYTGTMVKEVPIKILQEQMPLKQACGAGCRRRPSPDEAPPIGKIHPFSKMAVTFEPLMGF